MPIAPLLDLAAEMRKTDSIVGLGAAVHLERLIAQHTTQTESSL
jgi:hypothetical protein